MGEVEARNGSASANATLILVLIAGLSFSFLIWFANDALSGFVLVAQMPNSPRLYPWQLSVPTVWSRASAWFGYASHQVVIWSLIVKAQRSRLAYTDHLKPVNIAAFAVTLTFISLHFLQTHVFYDGLAQDVPEWTAMTSVILLLLIIILMENQRRGVAFGKKWGGFVAEAGGIARRYHGYYFSWATIYTFWYHPMVFTPGHSIGFFYMFLLLTQGSLLFTRTHLNKWWTLSLELLVLVHGVMIAAMHVGGSWQMFGFGLAGVFVVTQLFGLGFSSRVAWLGVVLYVALLFAFYTSQGVQDLPRVIRLLGGYYLALPIIAGLIVGVHRISGAIKRGGFRT